MSNEPAAIARQFIRWLKRWLGLHQPPQPSGTLELQTQHGSLWRINSNDPGVVVCYRLIHRDADDDLVISLVGLAQLREDIALSGGYRRSTDPLRADAGSFVSSLDQYLQSKGNLDKHFISHIFVVAWRSRIPRRSSGDSNSDRRAYLVRPIASIPCDLQGASFAWSGGDRYALTIAKVIARCLLLTTPERYVGWVEIVSEIDWLEWLDKTARRIISPNHTLQPHRKRNETHDSR